MSEPLRVSDLHFTASQDDQRGALLGFVRLVLNGALVLDGIALRRARDGRLLLSFPARRDAYGVQHFYARPINDAARLDLELQVFEALKFKQEAPP